MRIEYHPSSSLEIFGDVVYKSLVENFSQTFYVGGMIRDLLLHIPIHDIDIATAALPEQTMQVLHTRNIQYNNAFAQFGVITASVENNKVEIATMRQDLPSDNRYNEVAFIADPAADSNRRDFTINALYYNRKTGELLDFHNGLADIEARVIRAIGNPVIRFTEDPLRMIRALRFSLQLDFTLETNTVDALHQCKQLLQTLSQNKVQTEILKLQNENMQKQLQKLINSFT